jgi:cyclopropane fatty-acyl-phospholipid synthase-like methyltransferase
MHQMFRVMALAVALLWLAGSAAQAPHTHQHGFSGAERWARVFDDPARDRWQKPHQVIDALNLTPDATVADIGAGTGYFAARLARMVPKGRIYAADLEPDMVRYLADRARREGLTNLRPVQASPTSAELPEQVDRVLVVDTYHHIDDRTAYFKRLRDSLRPGGQVAIIDFTLDSPVGPPKNTRIPADQVSAEMKRAGYAQIAQHGFLPYQYFLVFRPEP